MTSIAEAYRKISKIVNSVDEQQENISNIENRIKSLENDLLYYKEKLTEATYKSECDIAEAKNIADSVNIPFEYSPPSTDEWDSSSSWDSSSQYC